MTTAVLELEAGRSTYFAGPVAQLAAREGARALLAADDQASGYDVDIARLERFVERFRYKKTKAKQAQAKLTQIGRLRRSARARGRDLAAHAPRDARSASSS